MSHEAAERFFRLRSEGGCFVVTDVARFAVTGTDRVRYLNGQVSNDVRKLAPGVAMQGCVLSAKGKLDAVVWLWAEPDRIVVECPSLLAEALSVRLERYIVADDVEISGLSDITVTHVFGPAAASIPDARKISRLNLSGADLVASVPADVLRITAEELELLRIEQAVPKWGAELGPATLPAEAGLDETAVDFHKGCYIGQEVVSRIRSVGHANRALRIFDGVDGPPPAPGTEFFTIEETGRDAAVVTSIHLSPPVGLCYIKRGTPEESALMTPDGASRIQLRHPRTLA